MLITSVFITSTSTWQMLNNYLLDAKSRFIRKDPDAGKDLGQERRRQQRMRWLDSITDSTDMNLSKLGDTEGQGKTSMLQSMGLQRVAHNLETEQQQRYI